jgi:ABC-2 type transport system ATP-binding protein/lipopolysaccharide transport system ATP-binding protein
MSIVIRVEDVTMQFNIAKERVDSIKEYFIKLTKRQLVFEKFTALDNISFTITQGEVVGFIGLNGAGKSTILKLISGILRPTTGKIERHGVIAPLIELGAGFDNDLTARENVFLNGAVLGYSRKQMESEYNNIIEFAELWEFEDVPIKYFSSGMKARLGFSIATIVKPEILIVDEILGVGDVRFKEKSEKRIKTMMSGGTTVLLVSHSIEQIRTLCTRVIWLKKGRIVADGDANEICSAYMDENAGH